MATYGRYALEDLLSSEVINVVPIEGNFQTLTTATAGLTGGNAFTGTQAITGADAAADALTAKAAADSQPRFVLDSDGGHRWGPGNAATDTYLYRSTINTLATDGDLAVLGGDVYFGAGDADTGQGRLWWDGAADIIGIGFMGTLGGTMRWYTNGINNAPTMTLDPAGVLTVAGIGDVVTSGQTYRGTTTQTLGAVAANNGKWRYFKALGGNLVINGPANTMYNPGATTTASTYTMPNGESTGWHCDGTYWTCY